MTGLPVTLRSARFGRHSAERIASAVAVACVVAIVIIFHGHACTGDGCLFCLAVHVAQALLCVSCGVAAALPLLMPLMVCVDWDLVVPDRQAAGALLATAVLLVAQTPVTEGIKLLI